MKIIVIATALLVGGCVEGVDLVAPALEKPAYCAEAPDRVVLCQPER